MDFKNERLIMSEEEARKRAKELLNEKRVDLITKYMFLEQQCKKQKEVIDKIKKEVNEQHTIMGCEVVENWVLLQILEDKEVSE